MILRSIKIDVVFIEYCTAEFLATRGDVNCHTPVEVEVEDGVKVEDWGRLYYQKKPPPPTPPPPPPHRGL